MIESRKALVERLREEAEMWESFRTPIATPRVAPLLREAADALEAGGWLPIESAPIADLINTHPLECLVYSPEIGGARTGRAWRNTDGEACGQATGYSGDGWNITHWQPLPSPPAPTTAAGVE